MEGLLLETGEMQIPRGIERLSLKTGEMRVPG